MRRDKWSKPVRIIASLALFAFVFSGISGCASLGAPVPETFNQKLAYAYGLVDGVATTADALYRAEIISYKETRDVYDTLQKTWSALDDAKKLYEVGKSTEGGITLLEATKMLEAVKSFLIKRSER